MTAPCERLNKIEARLTDFSPDEAADVLWMIGQIRSWQKFAKRVVDFGDVLRAENASQAVMQGYEQVFRGHHG